MRITNFAELLTSLADSEIASVQMDGNSYANVGSAISAISGHSHEVTIILGGMKNVAVEAKQEAASQRAEPSKEYRVKVRQYMTKPASPEFDFMDKWNGGVPMPMRVMVGKVIKETRGMVKMELHGEITQETTSVCMKCGRTLTNPVSRFFGIGPECGGHNYTNPFETETELKAAVAAYNEELRKVTWTGWIIRSAIEEMEEL